MVRPQFGAVMDHCVVGGSHGPLPHLLTDKEEVISDRQREGERSTWHVSSPCDYHMTHMPLRVMV